MELYGQSFGTVLKAIFDHAMVKAALGLLVADVLSGIAISLYLKEFRLAALGDFLLTRALPYFIGAGAVQVIILTVPPEYSGLEAALSTVVWGFVVAALLGHVLDNLKQMGLPIPTAMTSPDKIKAKPTLAILLPLLTALSLSACGGKSGPVLVGESATVTSAFIETASNAVEAVREPNGPIKNAQALTIQENLLAANGEIKKLIPVLRAIDAAQKLGSPDAPRLDEALVLVQRVTERLNIVVKGVPVAEAAAKLLEVVNNARGAIATVQATLEALKAKKAADLAPSIDALTAFAN